MPHPVVQTFQTPCCRELKTEAWSKRCGDVAGLSRDEQLWLAKRINDHIKQLTGTQPPKLPEPEDFSRRRITAGGGVSGLGGSVWSSSSGSDMGSPEFWDSGFDDSTNQGLIRDSDQGWWAEGSNDDNHSSHDSGSQEQHNDDSNSFL